MNFFEHQDQARRQTRVLVVLFALAVIAIALVMNLVVLVVFGHTPSPGSSPFSPATWVQNGSLIAWTSLITGLVIGLASLYRSAQLRGGGGRVARELGGVPVDPSTSDPLKRRLYNVVEEMAIASGVPTPEVFVLEQESAINAFAAGFTPSDAAVAVTRGTLETLDRDELQGVIAHEFSHIFNGDMRLNVRLMGVLFGILVLALAGRRVVSSVRYSARGRNQGAVVVIGLAVMVIGYVGLFFGRWIQAAVSRQREYLADASAVQFTRHPQGIGGALKKIAALGNGSRLQADTGEVGHMLFALGVRSSLFATHPPLISRIRAIEPGFDPAELAQISARFDRQRQLRLAEQEGQAPRPAARGPGGLPLNPEQLSGAIGRPGVEQILFAAAMLAAIPETLQRAARSEAWAVELISRLLLSDDPKVREQQLLMIAEALGAESEARVRALVEAAAGMRAEWRLPLLEMSLPALRHRPQAERAEFMALVERLINVDGRVEVFEYVLGRLCVRELKDTIEPGQVRVSGRARLLEHGPAVIDLFAVVAWHGHPEDADAGLAAFRAGLVGLVEPVPETLPAYAHDWPRRLDAALDRLDRLKPSDKQRLVEGLARCGAHDGDWRPAERELMRLVCGVLHVPVPPTVRPDASAAD